MSLLFVTKDQEFSLLKLFQPLDGLLSSSEHEEGGGDVAQLVEHRTGTSLRQVRFPGAARDFSPSQLSVQTLLRCPYNPVRNRMHQQ